VERPAIEVADIFGRFGASFLEQYPTSTQQRRVIAAITACRTAALGGHLEACDECDYQRNAYNSCRDRHCTKCGSLPRDRWVEARKSEVLPVPYFHIVFTLPEFLRPIVLQNQAPVYNVLFQSVAAALQKVAANPRYLGARIGLIAVLHTWNQQMLFHPHIHCIVPGGGLSPGGNRWIPARDKFFLPVRILSREFRDRFVKALRQAYQRGLLSWHGDLQHLQDAEAFNHYLQPAREKEWNVYSKATSGDPGTVVAGVSRYIHRIAISNDQIVSLDSQTPSPAAEEVIEYLGKFSRSIAITNDRLVCHDHAAVTFSWQDRRDGQNETRLLSITGHEFMRRFLMHVLPPRFVRLRQYGFLANAHRTEQLALCRQLLQMPEQLPAENLLTDWKTRLESMTGIDIDQCPMCQSGHMHSVATLLPQPRTPRRKVIRCDIPILNSS
jgi:hypothetical protein